MNIRRVNYGMGRGGNRILCVGIDRVVRNHYSIWLCYWWGGIIITFRFPPANTGEGK